MVILHNIANCGFQNGSQDPSRKGDGLRESVLLQRRAQKLIKFAFRYGFARSTHRILREGWSSTIKLRASLQRFAFQNSNERFTTAPCAKMYDRSPRHPRQPAASAPARGIPKSAFYHSFGRPSSTNRSDKRVASAGEKFAFTTVLSFRRPRSDEKVASVCQKSMKKKAFHQSFERPIRTK